MRDQNVKLVEAYYAAWGQGDLDALKRYCAENFIGHDAASGADFDLEGLKQRLAALHEALPDFRVVSEDIVAQGDRVVFRWRTDATSTGPFMGLSPTGEEVSYTGITIYRVHDGEIAELWNEWDNLRFLQGIGAAQGSSTA